MARPAIIREGKQILCALMRDWQTRMGKNAPGFGGGKNVDGTWMKMEDTRKTKSIEMKNRVFEMKILLGRICSDFTF